MNYEYIRNNIRAYNGIKTAVRFYFVYLYTFTMALMLCEYVQLYKRTLTTKQRLETPQNAVSRVQ